MINFHTLERTSRSSETQLKLGEHLNSIPCRFEG